MISRAHGGAADVHSIRDRVRLAHDRAGSRALRDFGSALSGYDIMSRASRPTSPCVTPRSVIARRHRLLDAGTHSAREADGAHLIRLTTSSRFGSQRAVSLRREPRLLAHCAELPRVRASPLTHFSPLVAVLPDWGAFTTDVWAAAHCSTSACIRFRSRADRQRAARPADSVTPASAGRRPHPDDTRLTFPRERFDRVVELVSRSGSQWDAQWPAPRASRQSGCRTAARVHRDRRAPSPRARPDRRTGTWLLQARAHDIVKLHYPIDETRRRPIGPACGAAYDRRNVTAGRGIAFRAPRRTPCSCGALPDCGAPQRTSDCGDLRASSPLRPWPFELDLRPLSTIVPNLRFGELPKRGRDRFARDDP